MLIDIGAARPVGAMESETLASAKTRASQTESECEDFSLLFNYQQAHAVFVDNSRLSQLPGLEILKVRISDFVSNLN